MISDLTLGYPALIRDVFLCSCLSRVLRIDQKKGHVELDMALYESEVRNYFSQDSTVSAPYCSFHCLRPLWLPPLVSMVSPLCGFT